MLFLFIQNLAYCESQWLNISNNNPNNSSNYIEYLPEMGNAISSFIYTVFGFAGMIPKYQTSMYYLIMNLFIIMGIGSFLHHFFYNNVEWGLGCRCYCYGDFSRLFSLLYYL